MRNRHELDTPWWSLRLTFGLVPIVAGIDKFTHVLVDWNKYLSPVAKDILPISGSSFMMIIGVIEIVAGALVLSRFTRFGAYLVSAWLLGIAINLLTTGTYFDIAVRDTVMAISAFALAKLTELRTRDAASTRVRSRLRDDDIGAVPVSAWRMDVALRSREASVDADAIAPRCVRRANCLRREVGVTALGTTFWFELPKSGKVAPATGLARMQPTPAYARRGSRPGW
jgi:uncharacterized membrane protein YphA (DoxX/SURF4 family)